MVRDVKVQILRILQVFLIRDKRKGLKTQLDNNLSPWSNLY